MAHAFSVGFQNEDEVKACVVILGQKILLIEHFCSRKHSGQLL